MGLRSALEASLGFERCAPRYLQGRVDLLALADELGQQTAAQVAAGGERSAARRRALKQKGPRPRPWS
jgi:hypothetical protein